TGTGDHPTTLNAIVCDDLPSLTVARQAEDARIVHFVQDLTELQVEEMCEYRSLNGTLQRHQRRDILAHLFNHQTHHRGQAHAMLTGLGIAEPDPWDLLIMQRERS